MGNKDFKNGYDPFSDIIQSILSTDQVEGTEPVTKDTVVFQPPAETHSEEAAVSTDTLGLGELPQLDTYDDSGEFRSYDGNREYRSFDASLPDASPEEWYHFSEEDRELDESEELIPAAPLSQSEKDADDDDDDTEEEQPKQRFRGLKIFAHVLLVLLTAFSIVYLVAIHSSNPFIVKARTTYIQTAMATMNHKWLATAIIPGDIIEGVMRMQYESEETMVGLQSNWGAVQIQELPSFSADTIENVAELMPEEEEPEESAKPADSSEEATIHESVDSALSTDEETFFNLFWEVDYASMHEYIEANPDVLSNGWAKIDINAAGLDEEGTSIKTIHGDQVLAIDAEQGVILIRVYLDSSRGIMAICKDTSRVAHCAADTIGVIGQTSGRICDANNGLLSISGSAFWNDENGNGNGGTISGLGVCNGLSYGSQLKGYYKRIELREDGKMYIVDSYANLGPGTRDACEFMPAMLIDGEIILDVDSWDGTHPRTCLGQSERLETMMVVMEGRSTEYPGCTVRSIAEKMQTYGCVQALNLDGGTSAIMYYKGEYVTRCSNTNLPSGRALPTAWVYKYAE